MAANDTPGWVTLTEGETVLWDGHPSFRLIAPTVVFGLVIALAGIALTVVITDPTIRWLFLIGIPIGIAIIAWAYFSLVSTRYILTSEEGYRKHGIGNRNVAHIRLNCSQSTTYSQSATKR